VPHCVFDQSGRARKHHASNTSSLPHLRRGTPSYSLDVDRFEPPPKPLKDT
jgi:hypothetical protein